MDVQELIKRLHRESDALAGAISTRPAASPDHSLPDEAPNLENAGEGSESPDGDTGIESVWLN